MKKELIPGWLLMAGLAGLSLFIQGLVTAGGKHPLEASAVAVVLGLLLRNLGLVPKVFHAGIKAFEKFLIWGVILIGATLNFKDFRTQGARMLAVILVTMIVGLVVIYALARVFKLPAALATLLAVGTTICGGSAIAITAPLIQAKEDETCYAIGTITMWGLLAILVYPLVARLLGVGDVAFGVFAGTAIHATPQVVGAGFIYSDLAGKTATAVKLVRNCFMAPLAFLIAAWWTRTRIRTAREQMRPVNAAKAFPWFLFGFYLMASLSTAGYFTKAGLDGLTWLGKFLITVSMAGIGLNTLVKGFRSVGIKPLLVGLLGAVVVAGVSAAMIALVL